MKKLTFVNENLDNIQDLIHDCWFDLDKIKFIKSAKQIVIPFRREDVNKRRAVKKFMFLTEYEIPMLEYDLVINNVADYKIIDKEKVRFYDFNVIEYEENNNLIIINTGIPLTFTVSVDECEIELIRKNDDFDAIKKWSLF